MDCLYCKYEAPARHFICSECKRGMCYECKDAGIKPDKQQRKRGRLCLAHDVNVSVDYGRNFMTVEGQSPNINGRVQALNITPNIVSVELRQLERDYIQGNISWARYLIRWTHLQNVHGHGELTIPPHTEQIRLTRAREAHRNARSIPTETMPF